MHARAHTHKEREREFKDLKYLLMACVCMMVINNLLSDGIIREREREMESLNFCMVFVTFVSF